MGKVKKSGETRNVRRTSAPAAGNTVEGRAEKPAPRLPAKATTGGAKRSAAAMRTTKAAAAPQPAEKARTQARTAAKRSTTRTVKAAKAAKPGKRVKAVGRSSARRAAAPAGKSGRVARRVAAEKPAPDVRIKIRELDPRQMCGMGTSVVRLIRVDEIVDQKLDAHLVYFDRHGWYCEHGRTCRAVGPAQKHAQHVARSQYVGIGPNNGRMRA